MNLCEGRFCSDEFEYILQNGEAVQNYCFYCLMEQMRDLVKSNDELNLSKRGKVIICF